MAKNLPTAILEELKRRAREASAQAYVPYSGFRVGAAVLTADGAIHAAANVENSSFGLTVCAERNAIFQAVSEGARSLQALVVYAPTRKLVTPCGACRQVMHEFGPDALVVCCNDDERAERRLTLRELLPEAFGSDQLAASR